MKRSKLLLVLFAICMAGFGVFYVAPFTMGLLRSFSGSSGHFTFDNYISLFDNKSFQLALSNTILFTLSCIIIANVLGFVLAYLLGQVKKRSLFYGLLLPLAVPVISTTSFWNYILSLFPYDISYGSVAFYIILLVFIWKYIGFHVMIYYAAIRSIPKNHIEAASLDGGNSLDQIRYIILPQIRSFITFNVLFSVIHSFKIFRDIYLIYGNYPPKGAYLLQHFIQNNYNGLMYHNVLSASNIFTILAFAIFVPLFVKQYKEAKL